MCMKFSPKNLNPDIFPSHPHKHLYLQNEHSTKIVQQYKYKYFLKKEKTHTVIEDSYVAIIACNYANCQSKQLIMEDT